MNACFHCGKLLIEAKSRRKRPIGIGVAVLVILLLGGAYGGHHLGYYSLPLLPERAVQGQSETAGEQESSGGTVSANTSGDAARPGENANSEMLGEDSSSHSNATESTGGVSQDPVESPTVPTAEPPASNEMPNEVLLQESQTPEESGPEEQPPVSFPAPSFSFVTASATLAPIGDVRYDPHLVLDGRTDTAWAARGAGHWIELSAREEQHVSGIRILSGYTKFNDNLGIWLYHANNRPKDIRIQFSDGTIINLVLEDLFDPANPAFHDIQLESVKVTTSIRVFVDSVYSGDRWDDTCITLFEVY